MSDESKISELPRQGGGAMPPYIDVFGQSHAAEDLHSWLKRAPEAMSKSGSAAEGAALLASVRAPMKFWPAGVAIAFGAALALAGVLFLLNIIAPQWMAMNFYPSAFRLIEPEQALSAMRRDEVQIEIDGFDSSSIFTRWIAASYAAQAGKADPFNVHPKTTEVDLIAERKAAFEEFSAWQGTPDSQPAMRAAERKSLALNTGVYFLIFAPIVYVFTRLAKNQ